MPMDNRKAIAYISGSSQNLSLFGERSGLALATIQREGSEIQPKEINKKIWKPQKAKNFSNEHPRLFPEA